ncbi:MAG: dTDP-4-dehydrorhamnose reductase [Nitrospirae bacterium]|nr:dTDP-4-dehydrorhamnose reductase [Nitrospirota bacterium]
MKILVTGSDGMLAQDLIFALKENNEVMPFSKQEMDITQKDAVIKNIKSNAPDIVINCAAYTKVDTAEEEREKAFQVNGIGVQNLAVACAEMQIPLCHISTDYVFDGRKNKPYTPFDAANPLSIYGESKLAGEKYIQWIMNKFYIVRTSGLYGRGDNNFVVTILRLAKERRAVNPVRKELSNGVKVVTDQICSPTYTVSLSAGIKKLIESGSFGIYHITDDSGDGISWFDYAREIVSMAGIKAEIIPVTSEEFPRPAKRPAYSVLDTEITRLAINYTPEKREVALKTFLSTANL